ncbi:DUF21-domain-containing protein [Auriculariales sp. MPI-PUGE-AT-0066]|nr:DUF21-domain-containing protein [Auriculariales sp. MPI-PUGE-AT-0066]
MPRIQVATTVGALHGAVRLGTQLAQSSSIGVAGHGGGEGEGINQPRGLLLGIAVALVVAGGIFAGLTIGLMGLDDSTSVYSVYQLLHGRRHWVLVALLLSNVVINESLPIFLDSALGGGVAAVAISTTMIVIFGIIPQSICARYGLSIGAACAPYVMVLLWVLAPIAWPIAKLLDYLLGSHEANTYKKASSAVSCNSIVKEEPLRDDEIAILNGVLSLNDQRVADIMTPMKDVFTLSEDDVLDNEMLDKLVLSGFSRVPVHEAGKKDNFIGLLILKQLLRYDPDDCKKVSDFHLSLLPEANERINCFQALDYFQTGRSHLLLISKTPGRAGGALGIVTFEDVIEEILQEEVVDETDQYEDNQSRRQAKRQSTAEVMKGIYERNIASRKKAAPGLVTVTEAGETTKLTGNGHQNYNSTA